MTPISLVVKNALCSGYLTLEAEEILRHKFDTECCLQDISALTLLQKAVISGKVKRLSQTRSQALSA